MNNEEKTKLFERMIATKNMWDIRNTDGTWRNLNIDPLDKDAKMKAINYVARNPGLSCGPNPGAGIDARNLG